MRLPAIRRRKPPFVPMVFTGLCLWVLLVSGCAVAAGNGQPAEQRQTGDHVVLLHGLARTDKAMRFLSRRLTAEGFDVYNIGYPSRKLPPEELVRLLSARVQECCATDGRPVHFVGHSLGAVLIRAYLDGRPLENLGRVVLLAPPSAGSELVDVFGDQWWFGAIFGPTARTLGTARDSFPNRIGPPYYEVGVIAGKLSFNPVGSMVIPGPDDGMVSVERTRLEGMTDHLVISTDHVLMRYNGKVADEVVNFLKMGHFLSSGPDQAR